MKIKINSNFQTQSIIAILNDQWMDSSEIDSFYANVRERVPRVRKFRPDLEDRLFREDKAKTRRLS